jgi:hypothetical protein
MQKTKTKTKKHKKYTKTTKITQKKTCSKPSSISTLERGSNAKNKNKKMTIKTKNKQKINLFQALFHISVGEGRGENTSGNGGTRSCTYVTGVLQECYGGMEVRAPASGVLQELQECYRSVQGLQEC